MLDFDKDEDLQRMYSHLSQISEGLEPLRKKFEEHVKRASLLAVERLTSGGEAASEESIDPKEFVNALCWCTRSETVERSFRGEEIFVDSLDKACCEFVNWNAAIGTSSNKNQDFWQVRRTRYYGRTTNCRKRVTLRCAGPSGE